MPSRLLTEWMAFDELEPISLGRRVDIGFARLASLAANIYRNRDIQTEPFTLNDFMPAYDRQEKPPMTGEELIFQLKAHLMAHNARNQRVQ